MYTMLWLFVWQLCFFKHFDVLDDNEVILFTCALLTIRHLKPCYMMMCGRKGSHVCNDVDSIPKCRRKGLDKYQYQVIVAWQTCIYFGYTVSDKCIWYKLKHLRLFITRYIYKVSLPWWVERNRSAYVE